MYFPFVVLGMVVIVLDKNLKRLIDIREFQMFEEISLKFIKKRIIFGERDFPELNTTSRGSIHIHSINMLKHLHQLNTYA